MKATPAGRPVTRGIDALARAVRKPRRRGARPRGAPGATSVLLTARPSLLGRDEVLIAVAGGGSVVLRRVAVPAAAAAETPGGRLADIARLVAEMDLIAREIAGPATAAAAAPALTEPEERLLREGGLAPGALAANEARLLHRATAEYARLLVESDTVEAAARRLGVNTSRIRQRLTGVPPTLYGIKPGRTWRVPKFQFDGKRLVPGIERVVQRLPGDLHPVAVHRWFTSPNVDLGPDDRPLSPLDWLRSGNPPDAVADLAAAL
ncbi:MAG: hypothetical protein ACREM3_13820 [Candidatus Rokuibacteriota bacterium]